MSMNIYPAIHMLRAEADAIERIAESLLYSGAFQDAVEMLKSTDVIWFTGIGKSGLVAQRGASMMRTVGFRANFIDPVAALHGECGAIELNDVIVALSHSGETEEVLDLLDWRLRNRVVALCKPGSALAAKTRVVLPVDCKESLPTVSCAVQSAWIDALVIASADNVEQILRDTHPSGGIGRRLQNGKDTHTSEDHIEEGAGRGHTE